MDKGDLTPTIVPEGKVGFPQPKEGHEKLSRLIFIFLSDLSSVI